MELSQEWPWEGFKFILGTVQLIHLEVKTKDGAEQPAEWLHRTYLQLTYEGLMRPCQGYQNTQEFLGMLGMAPQVKVDGGPMVGQKVPHELADTKCSVEEDECLDCMELDYEQDSHEEGVIVDSDVLGAMDQRWWHESARRSDRGGHVNQRPSSVFQATQEVPALVVDIN
ncbi:hypothetical protein NDU88_004047 [Pleurodeles waltl]|uniref:Uncharacterized protein n=1 Tax=Pleurodeles waltl TaxID=8319 RepID=A0AAV7VHM0_PLEWA|nr:hypothetical protein NDU88_004047 [Pleurodeles waltl]